MSEGQPSGLFKVPGTSCIVRTEATINMCNVDYILIQYITRVGILAVVKCTDLIWI